MLVVSGRGGGSWGGHSRHEARSRRCVGGICVSNVLCRHIHGGQGVEHIIRYILVAQVNESIMCLGVRDTGGAFLVLEALDEFDTQARVQVVAQFVDGPKFPIRGENSADPGVQFLWLSAFAGLHSRGDHLQHRIQQRPGACMLNRMSKAMNSSGDNHTRHGPGLLDPSRGGGDDAGE